MLKMELNKVKGVDFKYHEPDVSYIEAVFARGDRKLSRVLYEAVRLGCHFDGWTEFFDNKKWMLAFENAGINPDFYAARNMDVNECLAWGHIDSGVSQTFLKREWEKAQKAETTQDCRKGCVGCGVKRYGGACQ